MDVLYLLIPLAMLIAALIAALFFWSVRSGQFDDLDSPAMAIIMDDDSVAKPEPNKPDDNAKD